MWFGKTSHFSRSLRTPLLMVVISLAAIPFVASNFVTAHAFGPQCYYDRGYWTPETGATYSQSAGTCNSGYMQVTSSATVTTLVPQSGSYSFAACRIPQGQNPYCDRHNAIYYKAVNTAQGIFPNDSATYYANGANSWYTSLDVTVLDTTTGTYNDISSLSCTSTVGACPL
jgi:hypothetical protein